MCEYSTDRFHFQRTVHLTFDWAERHSLKPNITPTSSILSPGRQKIPFSLSTMKHLIRWTTLFLHLRPLWVFVPASESQQTAPVKVHTSHYARRYEVKSTNSFFPEIFDGWNTVTAHGPLSYRLFYSHRHPKIRLLKSRTSTFVIIIIFSQLPLFPINLPTITSPLFFLPSLEKKGARFI
jgi:hypothetical protein